MLDANNKYYRALVCVPKKTRDLLKFLSFFAPDDIPTSFLMRAISLKIGMTNSMLHCLRQRILMVQGAGLHMPPELQEHLRDTLSFADSAKYISRAISVILERYPANLAEHPDTWDFLLHIVPHSIRICNYAELFDIPIEQFSTLLCQTALLLILAGQYPAAEPLLRKILQLGDADSQNPNPHSAFWLRQMALVMEQTGRNDQAQSYIRRADEIDKLNK